MAQHGPRVQDTINVQELRFGDNDTLSAQVAALVEADWLVLLTDVDYLYTADPRTHPDATAIEVRPHR
jgi:glutamate 5-kinase